MRDKLAGIGLAGFILFLVHANSASAFVPDVVINFFQWAFSRVPDVWVFKAMIAVLVFSLIYYVLTMMKIGMKGVKITVALVFAFAGAWGFQDEWAQALFGVQGGYGIFGLILFLLIFGGIVAGGLFLVERMPKSSGGRIMRFVVYSFLVMFSQLFLGLASKSSGFWDSFAGQTWGISSVAAILTFIFFWAAVINLFQAFMGHGNEDGGDSWLHKFVNKVRQPRNRPPRFGDDRSGRGGGGNDEPPGDNESAKLAHFLYDIIPKIRELLEKFKTEAGIDGSINFTDRTNLNKFNTACSKHFMNTHTNDLGHALRQNIGYFAELYNHHETSRYPNDLKNVTWVDNIKSILDTKAIGWFKTDQANDFSNKISVFYRNIITLDDWYKDYRKKAEEQRTPIKAETGGTSGGNAPASGTGTAQDGGNGSQEFIARLRVVHQTTNSILDFLNNINANISDKGITKLEELIRQGLDLKDIITNSIINSPDFTPSNAQESNLVNSITALKELCSQKLSGKLFFNSFIEHLIEIRKLSNHSNKDEKITGMIEEIPGYYFNYLKRLYNAATTAKASIEAYLKGK